MFFFFNDTATTEIYTLSLHDALPICHRHHRGGRGTAAAVPLGVGHPGHQWHPGPVRLQRRLRGAGTVRSEEHTSELQSRQYLVCRLLLEKKNNNSNRISYMPPVIRTL